MRTERPEHLKTFDYIGVYRYFLTFCTHERARLFVKPEAVELVRTQIERAAVDFKMAVIAYCSSKVRQRTPTAGSSSRARSSIRGFTTRRHMVIVCGSDTDSNTCCGMKKLP
jgi:hypothetical protein